MRKSSIMAVIIVFLIFIAILSIVFSFLSEGSKEETIEKVLDDPSPRSPIQESEDFTSTKTPELQEEISCFHPSVEKITVVNVAVTSLWSESNSVREVDQSAVATPVDLKKWTSEMEVAEKEWLIGKLDTQALYGQEVVVLDRSENWVQIAVKDQYTPKEKEGYPGWVPETHITETSPAYEDCPIAIVDVNLASLYNEPNMDHPFMEISYTTILPVLQEEVNWWHVQTPADGVKYLRKQDAKVMGNFSAIPKPTEADIVEAAKTFLGLPYLWAGTSGFGFDCSGFTHSVYKNHGILIPRDSAVQAVHGRIVEREDIRPGDLMFFANNGGQAKVSHVGMYIGDGQMIHAPNSSKTVEIIPIDTAPYVANFVGARRYLDET